MMAEVASAKACALITGLFRTLRDVAHRDTAAGVLWIRDCKITQSTGGPLSHCGKPVSVQ